MLNIGLSLAQQRIAGALCGRLSAEGERLEQLLVKRSKGRFASVCSSRSIFKNVIIFSPGLHRLTHVTVGNTANSFCHTLPVFPKINLVSRGSINILFQFRRHYSNSCTMSSLFIKLVASAVKVADRGGLIVRDIMKAGDLGIVEKGVNDLQTEADRSCQRSILASFHKQFPDIKVIGEEEEDSTPVKPDWVETSFSDEVLKYENQLPEDLKQANSDNICVWVDPLDGTAEYTQGLLDHVTVLIGIAVNGKSVAGVIHQPFFNYQAGPEAQMGRTIWGIVGVGSFGFEPKKPDPNKRIVVTTRSHGTDAVRNAIAACEPTEVQKVGGAGHKVLLLIEGKAHAYIFASPGCKKWDTCAPEAVLHAIGGKLTDIHGNAFQYQSTVKHQNTGGVLGTAIASELDWYLSKIPAEVRDGLPA